MMPQLLKITDSRLWAGACIICMLLIVLTLGCGSTDNLAHLEELNFEVVDSLLGMPYPVLPAGIQFRPPASFLLAPDSILAAMRMQVASSAAPHWGVELLECLLDSTGASGVTVSLISGLNLDSDTLGFFGRYRVSLDATAGEANVKEGDNQVGGVFVKSFVIADSSAVRIQLLCVSPSGDSVELTYFTLGQFYPIMEQRIKSSIGSIVRLQ